MSLRIPGQRAGKSGLQPSLLPIPAEHRSKIQIPSLEVKVRGINRLRRQTAQQQKSVRPLIRSPAVEFTVAKHSIKFAILRRLQVQCDRLGKISSPFDSLFCWSRSPVSSSALAGENLNARSSNTGFSLGAGSERTVSICGLPTRFQYFSAAGRFSCKKIDGPQKIVGIRILGSQFQRPPQIAGGLPIVFLFECDSGQFHQKALIFGTKRYPARKACRASSHRPSRASAVP